MNIDFFITKKQGILEGAWETQNTLALGDVKGAGEYHAGVQETSRFRFAPLEN